MLDCESRFAYARRSSQGNTMVNSGYASQPANYAYNQPLTVECQAFDVFRNCVFTATSRHCYASDQEYQFTYLFDHARNLAYSCPPGQGVLPSNVYIHNSLNPMNPLNPINSDYNRRSDLSYPNAISNGNYPNQQYPAPSSSFAGRQLPTYQLAGNQPASTSKANLYCATPLPSPSIVCSKSLIRSFPFRSARWCPRPLLDFCRHGPLHCPSAAL